MGLLLGLALTGGYVAALYILPHQLGRDHRQTVQKRMACTLGYGCVAWIPVYLYLGTQVMNLSPRTWVTLTAVSHCECTGNIGPMT